MLMLKILIIRKEWQNVNNTTQTLSPIIKETNSLPLFEDYIPLNSVKKKRFSQLFVWAK